MLAPSAVAADDPAAPSGEAPDLVELALSTEKRPGEQVTPRTVRLDATRSLIDRPDKLGRRYGAAMRSVPKPAGLALLASTLELIATRCQH
jgi:hypothetical protein